MQNMDLDGWLMKATRCLSTTSAAQVRKEIQEHYESSLETALRSGVDTRQAEDAALHSLGDARVANRGYRKVLLTATEARMLKIARHESSAVCARPFVTWLLGAVTILGLLGAGIALIYGADRWARLLFVVGSGNGVFTASLFFQIRTPRRARIYRGFKWVVVLLITRVMFGPDLSQWLFGAMVCFGAMIWTEWTYYSIRKKLPVAEWPRALFY
jgi:hypothetical protein